MTNRRRRRPLDLGGHADNEYMGTDTESETGGRAPRNPAPEPSARVMEIVRRARQARQEAEEAVMNGEAAEEESQEDLNPANRMGTVRARAPEYEREYRLRLIHRLLMRRVPLDEIANQLEVSVSTVRRDRQEIYERLQKEISTLDMNAFLGETMAFYGETGAMAMRLATSSKTATPHRLAALRTAMTSRKELGQFFAAAGVFEKLPLVIDDTQQSSDLGKLVRLAEQMLDEDIEAFDDLSIEDDMMDDDSVSMVL